MMRWKRLILCVGGSRCADLVAPSPLPEELPSEATLVIEYTCGRCGTHYIWDSASRKRMIDDKPVAAGGFTLAPGETKEFTFEIPKERL